MNKDEQLITQVLSAYNSGKIDFSQVPALEELVLDATLDEVERYTNKIDHVTSYRIDQSIQEIDEKIQTKLDQLNLDRLKEDLLNDIYQEKQNLSIMNKDIEAQKEEFKVDSRNAYLKNRGLLIANIVCLLCFLVVSVLLGRWLYYGIWDGWGLHILWDTVVKMQPDHPYAAVVLGLGGFGFIGLGIYASFRLMYEASTTWLDKRPKIFKKIFPKK